MKKPTVNNRNDYMIRINPSDINDMDVETLVLVNKISINSQLAKLEREKSSQQQMEAIALICEAVFVDSSPKEIQKYKSRTTRTKGAIMTVGSIIKCFPNLSSLPMATFAKID
ncbi:MAG: hypothetical protein AB1Z23_12880 [Eubacteriales bacterium]